MRGVERENAMNSDFRDKLSTPQQWLRSPFGMVILIACIIVRHRHGRHDRYEQAVR